MEAGTKYDQEKPLMYLLDPSFMEGLAKVLTFGANKYSVRGNCDCPVKLVKEILEYKPEDYVKLVMTNILKQSIQTIDKDNMSLQKNGLSKIEIKSKLINKIEELETLLIQKLNLNDLDKQPRETIIYQMSSWIDSWSKGNVQFAEVLKNWSSITAIQQEKFEQDFVKHVTSLWDFLKEVSGTLMHSPTCQNLKIIKTGEHNWRGGIAYSRLISAAYRHLGAINRGEDIDPESGLPHVYHLACNVMFLSWMMENKPELDDRFKYGT